MWLSEKLDGCRAFWDGECLRTKDSWLRIDAPEFITAGLPEGAARDGELWAGYGSFETMRVLVQFPRRADPRWRGVTFNLFDAPTTEAVPVEARWRGLEVVNFFARIMPQVRVSNLEDMQAEFARVIARGGEGLVLRRPGHFYEFGRSRNWLKVKPSGVD